MDAPTFISFHEAQTAVLDAVGPLPSMQLPVERAVGRRLAEQILSPVDMPPFDNSAMDGYAVRWRADWPESLEVTGAVAAGEAPQGQVGAGEAWRIFTGAPVPPGADTIIQQEWVEEKDGHIRFPVERVQQGHHVRPFGSQIRSGEVALEKGQYLRPGAVGFLANLGIPDVTVIRPPVIDIIVTGSELVAPGEPLQEGKIYESNSHALVSALTDLGESVRKVHRVPDDPDTFARVFQRAVQGADLVLITGGISVGDHDIARIFLAGGSAKAHFYKVRQRPGKPLFFGELESTYLFALPGNPASVLSCFYQYVYPALRRMGGHPDVRLPQVRLPLTAPYRKKPGLTFFLKGQRRPEGVLPLDGQLSYIMRSFAVADCVIELAEEREQYAAGEEVTVHILDRETP